MAWALDQILGSAGTSSGSTSLGFNTAQTVAAGAWIYIGFTMTGGSVTSFSGGGLTWGIVAAADNGADGVATLGRAYAPSGLASGTTLTGNLSANPTLQSIGAASFTGSDATSAIEDTGTQAATTNAMSVGVDSTSADALEVAVGSCNSATATLTVTGPSVEDIDRGANFGFWLGHRILGAAGAYTVAGTWTTTIQIATAAGAFGLPTATPQELRPDADITTTGWSTAPLYSKINDESDATLVTATLA